MLAFLNLADHFSLFPTGAENLHRFVRVFFFDDNAHADAHVEGVEHIPLRNIANLLNQLENRQYIHRIPVDNSLESLWNRPRNVFIESASGDVGNGFDLYLFQQPKDRFT